MSSERLAFKSVRSWWGEGVVAHIDDRDVRHLIPGWSSAEVLDKLELAIVARRDLEEFVLSKAFRS